MMTLNVLANTFNDVSPSDWYFDYVEQLVDFEVVDSRADFRPNDPVNRAELVKMIIGFIGGLVDYEAPMYPTFQDVPENEWYYQWIEAATQLGIVSGHADEEGNLTGFFGPGDSVTRAAAAKIIKEGLAIPKTLSPPSPFPDVKPGVWYHDYILTLYNQSIVDGYDSGYFGPSNLVTRAEVAKMIMEAYEPPIIN
jgi:hypothetical protein